MVVATRNWIVRQLSLGEFNSRGDVFRHAIWMALKIAAVAYGMNLVAHFALYGADLLPYDLFKALVIATVLTPPVSFIVAVVAYSVVGFAIYDLAVSRAELERLSRTDMLSGLLNRRAFHDAFDDCGGHVAMALFDVDRFKTVNDTHGHKAGDDVIVAIADMLRGTYGPNHICARIGGEEFAVLSHGCSAAEVKALAENARLRIAGASIPVGDRHIHVTISGGIAQSFEHPSFGDIFAAADSALYLAKASGRNRIIHAGEVESPVMRGPVRVQPQPEAVAMRRSA